MSLRETRQKQADGAVVTPLQLAESVWNSHEQRSEVRIVDNGGRADDPHTSERLRQLARSRRTRCAPEESVVPAPQWRLVDAWPYGALYVLEAIWHRLDIAEVIAPQLASRTVDVAVERGLLAMVANQACAPSSKLYCDEQWGRDDVRMDGTESLIPQQLYRAMDVLGAHTDAIEQTLYFRLAHLFNLDVELIFYDTTSLHVDIDDAD